MQQNDFRTDPMDEAIARERSGDFASPCLDRLQGYTKSPKEMGLLGRKFGDRAIENGNARIRRN